MPIPIQIYDPDDFHMQRFVARAGAPAPCATACGQKGPGGHAGAVPLPQNRATMHLCPMRRPSASLLLLQILLTAPASPQASPYLPLDDPRLPVIEHLITRGDLRDPSPMLRPFRRADLLAALAAAELAPGSPAAGLAATLRAEIADSAAENWWRVSGRGGVQGFTSARRDQLRPAGGEGVRGYGELLLEARLGSVVAVSRGVAENRLKLDPDWPGDPSQRTSSIPTRFVDAYLSAQWRHARLTFGQRERNWGPVGLPGIGVSNAGYPRTDLEFELTAGAIRFTTIGARLRSAPSPSGEPTGRYFAAHRLAVTPTPALTLALWETAVIADRFDNIDTDFFNPLTLLSFSTRFGWGDDRNVLLGGDIAWRARPGLLLEAQAALDDYNPGSDNPYPNRWAFAVGASGPLGGRAAWRARYTTATSLAFRTLDPVENLLDAGVGLGRNFADTEEWHLQVSLPVRNRWLVAPEAALVRQGQGDPRAPWPTPEEAASIPTRFIGEVVTTWRLGLSVAGGTGPVRLQGAAGWHHTGRSDPTTGRLEAQMTATIGFTTGGIFR